MFRIFLFGSSLVAAYFWGDWKHWPKHYPTILYFIINSLLYLLLSSVYPLWRFEPLPPTQHLLPNGTLIAIFVTFTIFPATALIYLGHYPAGKLQYPYIALWVLIYTAIEYGGLRSHAISYHHGWSLAWSTLFNAALFSFVRVHSRRPLLAWLLSLLFTVVMTAAFRFPLRSLP